MRIKFWGVRGSIASPGPETAGVGGNTSSIEVTCGATRLLLDAGTGIRRLGDALLGEGPVDAALLLSHLHWDHIQGLPFFVPAYAPSTRLRVVGMATGVMSLRDALARQMQAPSFPVRLDELGAALTFDEVRSGEQFDVGAARVTAAKLNHPGGVLAYRVEHDGRSLVYATDTEHYACVDPALVALARGADVLVYDAQYTPDEYAGRAGRSKVGWGHSTYVAGAEVAREAGVGELVLFHHDPARSDAGVAEIERLARELFPATVAAREGLVLEPGRVARAA
ncbi:MAG TPA: MBL fold metallo-hydrolase [Minicystis sp.]|nr:MBL fold metallo-hydrolase [Minicystis sp.]